MLDPLSIDLSYCGPTPPQVVRPQRKLLKPSPDHPDDYILEIDYSSASEFTRCARASENLLINARAAVAANSATGFGDLFHRCEALRLDYGLSDAIISRQRELVSDYFLHNPVSPSDHRTASRMIETLDMYNKRYEHDKWPEKVYNDGQQKWVECPFKVPLCTIEVNAMLPYSYKQIVASPDGSGFVVEDRIVYCRSLHIVYTGKIDAVLSDSNLLWVVDHKTSSRGGSEFVLAFNLSLQTRGYVWAAQKLLSRPVAGLIMNALVIRPPTRTGKGTDLDRHTYFYSPDLIAEFETNMTNLMSDFVSMLVRGYFPQYARSFKSPCAGCGYQENCQLPMSQRAADLRSALYQDVTWNPMHE